MAKTQFTREELDTLFNSLTSKEQCDIIINNCYTKSEIDSMLHQYAPKSQTFSKQEIITLMENIKSVLQNFVDKKFTTFIHRLWKKVY